MSYSSHKNSIQNVEISATGQTDWLPTHLDRNPFNTAAYVLLSAGATLTYSVEYTSTANPNTVGSPDVFTVPSLEAIVDTQGNEPFIAPCTGIRLNVTAYTDGTATLRVIQAGIG